MSSRTDLDNTPVVVVCYNRPRHLACVLQSLRTHRVRNLHLFCDAPRADADVPAVKEVRRLVHGIDWTTPRVVRHESNQGLAAAVTGAVNSVLSDYDRLILLEDDCIPKRYYFEFVLECLRRYERCEEVMGISGYSVPIPEDLAAGYPHDVFLYPRIGSHGWATWRRAWDHYDPDLARAYRRCRTAGLDLSQGGADIPGNVERLLNSHDRNVWTLNWVLSVYLHGGGYLYPITSQIHNVGFDGSGMHFGRSKSKFDHNPPDRPILRFPDRPVRCKPLVDYYNTWFQPRSKSHASDIAAAASLPACSSKSGADGLTIAHINTHDAAGGAAKVAWRLVDRQNLQGHRSAMLVGFRKSPAPLSQGFDVQPDPAVQEACLRQGLLDYHLHGSHALPRHPLVRSADVLHLHNLHGGYFNPFSLPALTRMRPAVWTLHDMAAFTGHCAHAMECMGWLQGCSPCPHLDYEHAVHVDSAARLLRDKQRIYAHSRLWLVTPSLWLQSKVQRSILGRHPVDHIPNGIDTRVFRPHDGRQIRQQLGIAEDAFVVGAVAHGGPLANPWKGSQYTVEAIEALRGSIPNGLFLNVGGKEARREPHILHLPRIEDESVLAQVYSALDAFLYTPIADNCPLVVLEALACGVPVVTFRTGGIPELVVDGECGILAEPGDVPHLVQGVARLAADPSLRRRFAGNARDRAVRCFDHDRVADRYEGLYRRAIRELPAPEPLRSADVPEMIRTRLFLAACPDMRTPASASPPAPAAPPSPSVDVSIVLCTKNRAKLLDRMLASLRAAIRGVQCELVVIDGGSTDGTLDVLARHGVRHVYQESRILGPGRHSWPTLYNFGLSVARGRWGMYASDDIVFSEGCMGRAVEQLDRCGPGVAGGVFFYRNQCARPDWDRLGVDFTPGGKFLMNYGLVRLDAFRDVGGLDEGFAFYCADTDLCLRLYSGGRTLIPLPGCFVLHNNLLDVQKQGNAARSDRDIRRLRDKWKHCIPAEQFDPRRLLWSEPHADLFSLPQQAQIPPTALDAWWHGVALNLYGRREEARVQFETAFRRGADHWLVRRCLADTAAHCGSPGHSRPHAPVSKSIQAHMHSTEVKEL